MTVTAVAPPPQRDPAAIRRMIGEGRTPVQRVAKVLSDKHKLAIFWELASGPKRFKELERALAPVTARVLTRNLRALETLSLVVRENFEVVPPKVEYRLSPLGQGLRSHIAALCDWSFANAGALTGEPPER